MDPLTFVKMLLLCIENVIFMIAGIILNSVVIICLIKSSQLRKNLCHFMILVLSCFDLAVVTITHPLLLFGTIAWSKEEHDELPEIVIFDICLFFHIFSMAALLTLTVERFLGLTYPLFHRTSVTKKRLLILQAFLTMWLFGQVVLFLVYSKYILTLVNLIIFLNLLISLTTKCLPSPTQNYRMQGLLEAQKPREIRKEKRKLS